MLEHVADPAAFLAEAHRVTKKGGSLIAAAPFLFYLHGMPHDYRRYSPDGLALAIEAAGFSVVEKKAVGGIIAFLSSLFFAPLFHMLKFLPVWTLYPLFVSVVPLAWLDTVLDTSSRLPANALVVGIKE